MLEFLDGKLTLQKVIDQAMEMGKVTDKWERGYAQLGWLILEVAEMQYWRIHYATFREYLESVSPAAKKTPAQLQRYFLTVRDLNDTFKLPELESIGITKAMLLRNAKDYALVLPRPIVEAALNVNTTAKDLKKVISTTLRMPEDEGDWMEIESFMVTAEERATIEQAIEVARHTEPLTKAGISESAQMKDVMTKLSQEFLGAHSGDGN